MKSAAFSRWFSDILLPKQEISMSVKQIMKIKELIQTTAIVTESITFIPLDLLP